MCGSLVEPSRRGNMDFDGLISLAFQALRNPCFLDGKAPTGSQTRQDLGSYFKFLSRHWGPENTQIYILIFFKKKIKFKKFKKTLLQKPALAHSGRLGGWAGWLGRPGWAGLGRLGGWAGWPGSGRPPSPPADPTTHPSRPSPPAQPPSAPG